VDGGRPAGVAPDDVLAAFTEAAAGLDRPLAPPRLLGFLCGLADEEGVLPPWTAWWDDGDDLFPDTATRAAVEGGQPRLRLAHFAARAP
jgi:hypothetical protein